MKGEYVITCKNVIRALTFVYERVLSLLRRTRPQIDVHRNGDEPVGARRAGVVDLIEYICHDSMT
jgi:hypothetical protein